MLITGNQSYSQPSKKLKTLHILADLDYT